MPFSRSGPLRGLDAYCKDDELSEIGSQLAEGSINAGTVKPWRDSAFVLLVLAKARLGCPAFANSYRLNCPPRCKPSALRRQAAWAPPLRGQPATDSAERRERAERLYP